MGSRRDVQGHLMESIGGADVVAVEMPVQAGLRVLHARDALASRVDAIPRTAIEVYSLVVGTLALKVARSRNPLRDGLA
jgi:hypothetical protein